MGNPIYLQTLYKRWTYTIWTKAFGHISKYLNWVVFSSIGTGVFNQGPSYAACVYKHLWKMGHSTKLTEFERGHHWKTSLFVKFPPATIGCECYCCKVETTAPQPQSDRPCKVTEQGCRVVRWMVHQSHHHCWRHDCRGPATLASAQTLCTGRFMQLLWSI